MPLRRLLEQPRMIIIIFFAVAVLMVSSALIELHQSKNDVYGLMEKQSHSLLESLLIASRNALQYNEILGLSNNERLLNNANLIRILYEERKISNSLLHDLAQKNNIYRINIFNRLGKKIYSSHQSIHQDIPEKTSPLVTLKPLFQGLTDTLIVGIKPARFEEGFRYTVAIAATDRSVIVLNIDAANLLELRKKTGFGALIRDIVENPGIIYVALQDTSTILAASGNVTELEPLRESAFLQKSLQDSLFSTRISIFNTISVFEAVHPFVYNGTPIGLLRLGLSLEPLDDINARVYRRLVVITIVLIALGSLVFIYIFIRQRYKLLENQYHVVETFSSDILKNVSDAILVYDQHSGIKISNIGASRLFKTDGAEIAGKKIQEILQGSVCLEIIRMKAGIKPFECDLAGENKYLLFSKSEFKDHENNINTILVIRDLTRQRQLESQIQRDERLSAMGELASGVAHEIRNPLNTIGTIAQQLDRDFEPAVNRQEYHELAQLVNKEVLRINKTITDFLRFSRQNPPNPTKFSLKDFFYRIEQQYHAMLKQKKIDLQILPDWQNEVYWDQEQIGQVFMNLMQNSIDALEPGGKITISLKKHTTNEVEIHFSDNGPGIKEEIRSRIFNLYFTTKAKGTGIGLSLVQRIINEHNGTINLATAASGTKFVIILPEKIIIDRKT